MVLSYIGPAIPLVECGVALCDVYSADCMRSETSLVAW